MHKVAKILLIVHVVAGLNEWLKLRFMDARYTIFVVIGAVCGYKCKLRRWIVLSS